MKFPFATTAHAGRRLLTGSALALSLSLGASLAPASAQDGTGAATPTPPGACAVVPAAVTSEDDLVVDPEPAAAPATPGASPVTAMATPAASPMASPVTPGMATDPLADDLEASATAIAGCLSDTNYPVLIELTSADFRGQLIGFGEPLAGEEFMALSPLLPEIGYQVLSVEDAAFAGEGTATATVTYQMAHQVRKSTWTFTLQSVQGMQAWVLDREVALEPDLPANTATITVTIEGTSFQVDPATVQGPSVAITATNGNDDVNEVLVLRLEDGATTQDLLQSTADGFPAGVTFVGQVTVFPGDSETLLLSGLQPGTYTIVDLLPNAQGLPNLVEGMEATFTVE